MRSVGLPILTFAPRCGWADGSLLWHAHSSSHALFQSSYTDAVLGYSESCDHLNCFLRFFSDFSVIYHDDFLKTAKTTRFRFLRGGFVSPAACRWSERRTTTLCSGQTMHFMRWVNVHVLFSGPGNVRRCMTECVLTEECVCAMS